jgi:hypothetical protein
METCGIFGRASRAFDAADSSGGNIEDARIEGGSKSIVISVVENRAREICICKVDTVNVSCYQFVTEQLSAGLVTITASQNYLLEILLLTDNHSYNEAMSAIRMISPDEILLHDGSRCGTLAKKVETECRDDARILYISRQVRAPCSRDSSDLSKICFATLRSTSIRTAARTC